MCNIVYCVTIFLWSLHIKGEIRVILEWFWFSRSQNSDLHLGPWKPIREESHINLIRFFGSNLKFKGVGGYQLVKNGEKWEKMTNIWHFTSKLGRISHFPKKQSKTKRMSQIIRRTEIRSVRWLTMVLSAQTRNLSKFRVKSADFKVFTYFDPIFSAYFGRGGWVSNLTRKIWSTWYVTPPLIIKNLQSTNNLDW